MKNLSKFKKTIYIRGIKWTIKVKNNLTDGNGNLVYGICSDRKKEILISAGISKEEFVETLLHEYMHACFFGAGMQDELIPSWVEHWFINHTTKDMILKPKFFRDLFRLLE